MLPPRSTVSRVLSWVHGHAGLGLRRFLFVLFLFHAEQTQAFQHRAIGYGEDDCRFSAGIILELIPIPGRDKETVFSSPVQVISNRFFFSDLSDAIPLDDVIDGAAGVALRFRRHAGWNELHPAADGRHGRPAAEGMGVFQQYAVVGIDLARGRRLLQSVQCVAPFIGIGQRATVGI
jgi:hypothetical protein